MIKITHIVKPVFLAWQIIVILSPAPEPITNFALNI
jgi:hypothetical protein